MARAGSSTKVAYGIYDFDQQPTPFVTVSQEMVDDYGPMDGSRWGRVDSISINGFLTGVAGAGEGAGIADACGELGPSGEPYGNLIYAQTRLLSGFGKDFQNLVITDTHGSDEEVYTGHNCVIRNVTFEDSRYAGLLAYSIELDAYDPQYWVSGLSGYGVMDPSDTYDFDQDPEDEVVKITHTVSAKGFNTENIPNALDNAINFVKGRTGYKFEGYVGFPKFITVGECGSAGEGTGGNPDVDDCCFIPILETQSETINRIEGTYSITETYEADPSGCSGIVLRYTTSLESGIDKDFATAMIDAEAKHSKTGDWEELRTYFKNLDFYDLLVEDIGYDGLNQVPVTLSVEEYETGRMITFNASYDNNQLFGADNSYYNYNVSLSTDEILDITSATIQGTITSRGNLEERMTRTSAHLNNTVYAGDSPNYLRARAQEVYSEIKGGTYSLRSVPSSLSIVSGAKGEIQVNATFDDAYTLDDNDSMRASTYSYQVKAALPVYKPKASVNENGLYVIFDTDIVNREGFSISSQLMGKHVPDESNASSVYSSYLEGKANTLVNTLRTHLADGGKLRLENETVNRKDTDGTISCSYSYSQDKPLFLDEGQVKIGD